MIGKSADEVLKMKGRSEDDIIANPKIVGRDENGFIVEWYYQDCTVVLKHDGKMYRVTDIR